MLLSDVCLASICLSVALIGPNSRTERPRETKIGTEVAYVTVDSDTTFKVKSQRSTFVANVLNSRNRCHLANKFSTCRGRRHIVWPRAQLVLHDTAEVKP